MTEETPTAPVVAAVPVTAPKPTWLASFKLKLHDDWQFIITRSWSIRFILIAFLLSAAEVFMPLFVTTTLVPKVIYATAMALVTGAAFVARLVAQKHEAPNAS